MAYKDLNEEQKAVYDWNYRVVGGFKKALWEAITMADDQDLKALEAGFPVEVGGYLKYRKVRGWWQEVQALAEA